VSESQELEDAFLEVQEFVAAGEDVSHWQYLLGNAVSARREDICDFLLSCGLDGSEELYWLAFGREDVPARLSLLKLFRRHGVRVSQEQNDNGDTSVHAAAEYGQLEILRFLVEEMDGSCAFRQVNDLDWTPLHAAVAGGCLKCARYLLEQGHDPNATAHVLRDDRLGWSILDKAVKEGNAEMVQLLLDWKADPDFPGWMWTTARDHAKGTPFEEVLTIPHLANPKFSPHRKEIERQLLVGQPEGSSIDWAGSRPAGPVMQLRGDPVQAVDQLQLVDPEGKTILRGRFRFLILTPEQKLHAFWMEESGVVPPASWQQLSEEQRSHLRMDRRNQEFRSFLDGSLS
jgi:ankyrin repeat protein